MMPKYRGLGRNTADSLAISLYERGYLSFGKARQLSNMTKWDFHDELGRRKIERHYDSFALEEDVEYGHPLISF